jgi:hypothetical protein
VATTNSYTLTGLQAPANYVYWVRKLCGVGDTSLHSDGYQFTTPCASVSSFPWVESFESEAVFDCWAQEGPGTWEWGTGDYSSSTGAGDGSYNILITHSSTGNLTKIISPVLQLSGADATLIFKHIQREWAGDQDELNVYYRTDQTSPWVLLANYPNDIQDWTTDTVTLPNTTATYQIAFEMVDGYGYGVAIDSVAVIGTAGAGCADPIISMDNMVVGENATDDPQGWDTNHPLYPLYDAILEADKTDALDNLVADEFPNGVEIDELEDFFKDEHDFILEQLGIDGATEEFDGDEEIDDEDEDLED